MVVSEGIYEEIIEKASLYDEVKGRIKDRIKSNIGAAIGKLRAIEKDLYDGVESAFGENPFSSFLCTQNKSTDEDAEGLLERERIPENFGPDEESFSMLLKYIDSFSEWQNKLNPSNLTPKNLKAEKVTYDSVTLSWDKVNSYCEYKIEMLPASSVKSIHRTAKTEHTFYGLKPGTEYQFRVRATVLCKDIKCAWSDVITVQTRVLGFSGCDWKECPDVVDDDRKYSVDGRNPRIAIKVNDDYWCTIIGNTSIPLNKVTSWSIKVLKSKDNNRDDTYIGVAPNDINQNDYNCDKCGWYFNCYYSALRSGPPHNYWGKEYGPRKATGEYVRTGDSVGVVMDTTKGDLSFVLNGVNLGVAYEGIPLDKPLVPCVLLYWKGDSVELVI